MTPARSLGVTRATDRRSVDTGSIDVLYLAHNRLEFTRQTFLNLLDRTEWDLVRNLIVYDDGSIDGTADLLNDLCIEAKARGIQMEYRQVEFDSPVEVMNDFVDRTDCERFAKIDNDIMVPPGWLGALVRTMAAHPHIDVLGMEAGRIAIPPDDFDGVYGVEPARWIGGVGLLRTEVLGARPRMNANGRWGWTEFQKEYVRSGAWISPDLAVADLSRMPFDPWVSLSTGYKEAEWERDWPKYHDVWCRFYWEWFCDQ